MMKKINHIAVMVDASGSMSSYVNKVKELFSQLFRDIEGYKDQENNLNVFMFDSNGRSRISRVLPHQFAHTYKAEGGTPLWEAVGYAIETLQAIPKQPTTNRGLPWEQRDEARLVIVLTDGQNTDSHFQWSKERLGREIKQLQRQGDWTFVFQVPPGSRSLFHELGVPHDNIREWAPTVQAFQETMHATSIGTQSYMTARTMGAKSISNFYTGETDLSQVKTTDLRQLDNLTQRFRILREVPREMDIQTFVEAETGERYLPGTAYYQLTKPEKIQATKQVALIEKGKKTIYGGPKARDLVGLMPYADGKITPGNHSNFDVFVQSTSTNRKLVRGSRVLVLK